MKTNIILALTLSSTLLVNACNTNKNNSDNDQSLSSALFGSDNLGKGPMTEKTYNLTFDEIYVSNSLKTEIIKSNQEKIIVSAPDDIIDDIEVKTDGDQLYVKVKSGIRNLSTNKVKVTIYANDFSKINASSSSSIVVKDLFYSNQLEISASSSASIRGDFDNKNLSIQTNSSGDYQGHVKAENLNLGASSSGQIIISGKAYTTQAQASSSGSISGSDFVTKSATLTASSSASIKMGVSENISGKASSSASVFAIKKGNIKKINIKESSSGSVTVK